MICECILFICVSLERVKSDSFCPLLCAWVNIYSVGVEYVSSNWKIKSEFFNEKIKFESLNCNKYENILNWK